MKSPNTELEEILDSWLVHDESCPASWSGIGSKRCECIAKDQKRNLTKALSDLNTRRAIEEVEECYADVMSVSIDRHIKHNRQRLATLNNQLGDKEK